MNYPEISMEIKYDTIHKLRVNNHGDNKIGKTGRRWCAEAHRAQAHPNFTLLLPVHEQSELACRYQPKLKKKILKNET
jgi:hypothetical protein